MVGVSDTPTPDDWAEATRMVEATMAQVEGSSTYRLVAATYRDRLVSDHGFPVEAATEMAVHYHRMILATVEAKVVALVEAGKA